MKNLNPLQLLGKYLIKVSVPLIFFAIIALPLSSCFHPEKANSTLAKYGVNEEEKIWLQEFFRDLLFNSPGAYTLYGTKPMSISSLDHSTQEDKKKAYEEYLLLSKEEKEKYTLKRCNFTVNYEKWVKIKNRFPITQYLMGVFCSPYEKKSELVLFLNVETTIKTIINHYEDFRCLLGLDFDPMEVVFEVEDRNSQFWNKVLRQHTLLGILLGFGRSNSWFFEWGQRKNKNAFFQSLPVRITEEGIIENYGPQKFSLPVFLHYGLHDDELLIEKYKKERKEIKDLYRGKDEINLALEWLTR